MGGGASMTVSMSCHAQRKEGIKVVWWVAGQV